MAAMEAGRLAACGHVAGQGQCCDNQISFCAATNPSPVRGSARSRPPSRADGSS